MKKGLLILVSLLSLNFGYAQDFEKNGNYITVGYVLDPFSYNRLGNGVSVAYERGITDVLGIGRIGVGGSLETSFYTYKYSNGWGTYNDKRFRVTFSPRAAYHFEFGVPKMDVYAGVGGAIHFDTDTDYKWVGNTYVARTSTTVRGGHYVFGGIRYYFTDAFGVYAELGHGHRVFSGGVVFAF